MRSQKKSTGKKAVIQQTLSNKVKLVTPCPSEQFALQEKEESQEEQKNAAIDDDLQGNRNEIEFGTTKEDRAYLDVFPQPKKPIGQYIFFSTSFVKNNSLTQQNDDEPIKYQDLMKMCGEKWATLTSQEKKVHTDQAEQDKLRYERQCAELKQTGTHFTLDDGSKSTDEVNRKLFKISKQSKLKVARKEATDKTMKLLLDKGGNEKDLGAINTTEETKEEQAPDLQPKKPLCAFQYFNHSLMKKLRAENEDLTLIQCVKQAGEKWATMSTEEKLPFEYLNLQDKLREQKQKHELKSQGFFLLDNGSKSTDVQVASKKKQKIATTANPPEKIQKSKKRAQTVLDTAFATEETATKRQKLQ